jgi:hypothetical protein
MQKSYGLARFVAIALLVFAGLILLLGLIGAFTASTRGFGTGWSEGSKLWFTIPILGATCSAALLPFLLGAILLLVIDVSRNLQEVRVNPPQKVVVPEPLPAIVAPVAAPVVEKVIEPIAPVVEAPVVAAETAVVVAEEVAPEAVVETPKPKKTTKPKKAEAAAVVAAVAVAETAAKSKKAPKAKPLPGAEEAAIVAAELAETKTVAVDLTEGQVKAPRISVKLADVAKIGPGNAAALGAIGIRSSGALLLRGATRQGREEIAAALNISPKQVLEWVNHLDLMRVRGVGEEYAQLLEASGVDTVPELAQRNAENLTFKLVQMNGELNLVRQTPILTQVTRWVTDAKALPRVITY